MRQDRRPWVDSCLRGLCSRLNVLLLTTRVEDEDEWDIGLVPVALHYVGNGTRASVTLGLCHRRHPPLEQGLGPSQAVY